MSDGLLGPQRMPASLGRLKAQAAQLVREQSEARKVRREWMALMGMSESEIDRESSDGLTLSLADELEQLAAVKRLNERPVE